MAAALVAWVRIVVVPRRPDDAGLPIPRRIPDPEARPSADGRGVRIAVNPSSGPAWTGSPAEALRAGLPGADIVELGPDDDLHDLLDRDDLLAVGAAGGDGTLSAVAAIAADRGVPLVAVPAGTLNHLARDLGLSSVDDAVAAVRAGTTARMDLAVAGERTFVNTLTLGGYTAIVDARERLEKTIGKWPALLVALARELPSMEPLYLDIDGTPERVWLAWIGNCRYSPPGFGPGWRDQLDDGQLDIRLVNGRERFSRTRFVLHVLTGRLASCSVYEERSAAEVSIHSHDGPLRLAADGETFDGPVDLVVSKRPRALQVAIPPYLDDGRTDPSERPTTTASTPSPITPAAVSDDPAGGVEPEESDALLEAS
ncbi:MAG: diacylglycerol kinase family protein [Acidimicrobiales bacterium]